MAPLPHLLGLLLPRSAPEPTNPLDAPNLLAHRSLYTRDDDDDTDWHPGSGAASPDSFNNAGFIALFAILGAGMAIASIWFFFWAKNGGFQFQEGDWDDYKSTVLRRKGPDGKTLSNATKSTKLGGGSVVHGQDYKLAKSEAKTIVGRDEKGRKGILAKRGFAGTHSVTYSDDYQTESFGTETVSDMTEVRTEPDRSHHHQHKQSGHHSQRYSDRDIKQYKRERPARVGGLNRIADGAGSHFDASTTDRSDTYTESSENLLSAQAKRDREQEKAERHARIEAAKMERRWKKEAEEAAAALARENASMSRPPKISSAVPAAKPTSAKQPRESRRSASRSASPKKRETRDFSYQSGPASEVLSTAYTGSSGARTASYYDAYRPHGAAGGARASTTDHGRAGRQSSPTKKPRAGNGYRRGADSDLD
ncbi:hypothetical protein MBLNU230_g6887t1 [Neophaeotheca triangularis]